MKNILFIGGTLNQTTMMHQISEHLKSGYVCRFTPYYTDGFVNTLAKKGYLDFTPLGNRIIKETERYLNANRLSIDRRGSLNDYDLAVTCSDLIVQKNLKGNKVILVQEGMTDPKSIFYYTAKYLGFPRYLASTSANGLSDAYDYFCVASEGYKKMFVKNGCNPGKVKVTGIPNFDNIRKYLKNNFPDRNYVLVCTSDNRETYIYENRKKFIEKAVLLADGRQMIFKLHPNENTERAVQEIKKYAPGSQVFAEGNTNEMIANCEVLITRYSSVVYIGLALGKEVYSDFNIDKLKALLPDQNGGTSSLKIAGICEQLLNGVPEQEYYYNEKYALPVSEY